MEIEISPVALGIIIGNQLIGVMMLITNTLNSGIERAFAIYGLVSAVVIYPTLIIYYVYKFVKGRKNDED